MIVLISTCDKKYFSKKIEEELRYILKFREKKNTEINNYIYIYIGISLKNSYQYFIVICIEYYLISIFSKCLFFSKRT